MKIRIQFYNADDDLENGFVHKKILDDGQGPADSVMVTAEKWLEEINRNHRAYGILLLIEEWFKERGEISIYQEMCRDLIKKNWPDKNVCTVV